MNLNGLRVVVTRPLEQSGRLAAAIEAAGGEACVFPLIEIGPPPDPAALDALVDRLDDFAWAVFSSPTAVDRAVACIGARRARPFAGAIAAIGEGTQRALARQLQQLVRAQRSRIGRGQRLQQVEHLRLQPGPGGIVDLRSYPVGFGSSAFRQGCDRPADHIVLTDEERTVDHPDLLVGEQADGGALHGKARRVA